MNYYYRNGVQLIVPIYWEVVPFLKGPLSEVPLYGSHVIAVPGIAMYLLFLFL